MDTVHLIPESLIRDKVGVMILPSRIGERLPGFVSATRFMRLLIRFSRPGYGSYDQAATTAYNSFSNRSLISLERFPARFYRCFTTYFSERSRPLGGVTPISGRTSFCLTLDWGLCALMHVQHAPARAIISRQKVNESQAGFT